jgi:hypothetical protein
MVQECNFLVCNHRYVRGVMMLIISFSQSSARTLKLDSAHRVCPLRPKEFRTQCCYLVYPIPSKPVPRHILCFKNVAEYVCFHFQ